MFQIHLFKTSGLIIILATLTCFISAAQGGQPEEAWNKTFGGPYGDGAWSLQGTSDGGYIIAGYSCSGGQGSDLWLVKTDSNGGEQWNRTFGGSGEDVGYAVRQTSDGGYILAGSTKSYGIGEERLWLLKTDSDGRKLWDRTFSGFVSSAGDGAWSVNETKDGGYIITGYTKSYGSGAKDLWLIKTDSKGEKVWDKTFGGSKDDVGLSVIQTRDSGYAIAGRTDSYGSGGDDIWLLKVDSSGWEEWNKTFGGSKDDAALQVLELNDGYILAGRTEYGITGSAVEKKACIIKTNSFGEKTWEKDFDEDSSALFIQQTDDGGFILAGSKDSEHSRRHGWLLKVDQEGSTQWDYIFSGDGEDTLTSVEESTDGGYVMAGITSSWGAGTEDAWLVKVIPSDANQSEINQRPSGDIATGNEENTTKGNSTQAETTAGNANSPSTETEQLKANKSPTLLRQKVLPFFDIKH